MCFPARARAHRQRRLRSNRSRSTLQRFPRQPFVRTRQARPRLNPMPVRVDANLWSILFSAQVRARR